MKHHRDKFGIREGALAIAVIFMIYLTATAFSLRSRILSKVNDAEESGGPEIVFSDSTRESELDRRRFTGHEMQQ